MDLEGLKYYPQVLLGECRYKLDDRSLRIDESDESDKMPESGDEINSEDKFDDNESENNDNNESEKLSKKTSKKSG